MHVNHATSPSELFSTNISQSRLHSVSFCGYGPEVAAYAGGETFLVVGFSGDGEQHDIATHLYKLDTKNSLELPLTGQSVAGSGFEALLSIPSVGVVDVKLTSIKTGTSANGEAQYRHLLLIANGS